MQPFCVLFVFHNRWIHDDVIKWKHFPRYWPFVRGIHLSPLNSPHNGQWSEALMFSLICVSINGRVNNPEAGDLRRYPTHYDAIVVCTCFQPYNAWFWCCGTSGTPLSTTTTVYPKKYAHGFCFAVLCCGYTLTDFPISIRLTSLALWQSNDCPSASKETLMNMDKYFIWIHYERLHNHNKAKHNKTVCIFLGIYCN